MKHALFSPLVVGLLAACSGGDVPLDGVNVSAAGQHVPPASVPTTPGAVDVEKELAPTKMHRPIRYMPQSTLRSRQDAVMTAFSSPTAVPMPDALFLRRLSLSLRSKLPTLDEYDALEAAQQAGTEDTFLNAKIDEYLQDDGFGKAIIDLHNDALNLDLGTVGFVGAQRNPAAVEPYVAADWFTVQQMSDSLMNAPLHLIRHVVENDMDYRLIVTADFVVADEVTSTIWDIENYDVAGPQWQELAYPSVQQKPAAGILADNIFFMRHASAGANYNRGRANAISKALVCRDFLDSDVPVTDIDLTDETSVQMALTQDPLCISCHQGVDAIARNFDEYRGNPNGALIRASNEQSYPWYFPGTWSILSGVTGRTPNWFGAPTTSLADLGQKIADDPRFSRCTAKRFYSHFAQVPLNDVPFEIAADLQRGFIDSGFNARALAKAVVTHPSFRLWHDPVSTEEDTVVGWRRARPPQIGRMFEDLTLFKWEALSPLFWPAAKYEGGALVPVTFSDPFNYLIGIDYWTNGPLGYRVLGGGVDALANLQPVDTANPTTVMVLRRAAQEQAFQVVSIDFAWPAIETQLLDPLLIDGAFSDEQDVRAAIAELHERFYGERVDPNGAEVDDLYAFFEQATPADVASITVDFWFAQDPTWQGIISTYPRAQGWVALLSAMLADPRILLY